MSLPVTDSSTSEAPTIRLLKQTGHVGFDSLPDQLVNKSIENGFVFNIMCIGETGLGKSTLMDTLFNTSFESAASPHTLPNVKLKANTYELEESNVRLKLTICDTLGYSDQINKHDSFKSVVDYIDVQFEAYLQEELSLKRSLDEFHDSRVHVCLYFISPTGHGLKSLDLICMKQLDSKVNIIPIIAKADSISKTELKSFKAKIMEELKRSEIQIYQFPTDDETLTQTNAAMNDHMPFAVVGSTEFFKIGKKELRARQYPWGTVQVENENHCDFAKLREMLIRTNMEDLREQTHLKHYELYRQNRLGKMGFCDFDKENRPIGWRHLYEVKYTNHVRELLKMEDNVRQTFIQRVKDKEYQLKTHERVSNICLKKLNEENDEMERRLEVMKQKLESECSEFSILKSNYTAAHSTLTLGKNRKK